MGRVHAIPDATTRSGQGPGMVSKDLTKIIRVRRIFIDRNLGYLPGWTADFRFWTDPGTVRPETGILVYFGQNCDFAT